MVLKYLNYDNLNIDEELSKIENCKLAEIVLEPNNKHCLFILGMLFVNGVEIKILNEKDLNLEETNKSFSMMPYVWSKIGDNNFPSKDYSNVQTEMDKRVENIKRIGVNLKKIINNPISKKIFLICPVRNATSEQREWIENYVREKYSEGYVIHAPHLHTRQTDLFGGYAICMQNAIAVAESEEIDIYYDQNSTGSVFDLGVAYALHKPLKILNINEIIFNEKDLIDNLIKYWPYNQLNIEELRNVLLNIKEELINIKKYRLIDRDGKEYLSDIPGTFGGNKKLKIYGRLDCPSAKRWIDMGFYVSNRVFFENEDVAIMAGYRPCAVCMRKEYIEWKEKQNEYKLQLEKK